MKIKKIIINNFRSFVGENSISFNGDYLISFGRNNSGKSNIINALRFFYKKNISGAGKNLNQSIKPKKDKYKDFWVQINYVFESEKERKDLKIDKFLVKENNEFILKLRRYGEVDFSSLFHVTDLVLINEKNEYLKIGKKNSPITLNNVELGELIYIPEFEINSLSSYFKKERPSEITISNDDKQNEQKSSKNLPSHIHWIEKNFREIIYEISKTIQENISLEKKNKMISSLKLEEYHEFNKQKEDEFFLKNFTETINKQLNGWNIKIEFFPNKNLNEIMMEIFPSSYPNFFIWEKKESSDKQSIPISFLGWGILRYLFYLLKKELTKQKKIKNDFLIIKEEHKNKTIVGISLYQEKIYLKSRLFLVEEPELFLHPSKQQEFNKILFNLTIINTKDKSQVFLTTHSPVFISRNLNKPESFLNVKMTEKGTKLFQLNEKSINEIKKLEEWRNNGFDNEKSWAFFTEYIFLVEGKGDKMLFQFLFKEDEKWKEFNEKEIYFLEMGSKCEIQKYVKMLEGLGMDWFLVFDDDGEVSPKNKHIKFLNEYDNKRWKNIPKNSEKYLLKEYSENKKFHKIVPNLKLHDLKEENLNVLYEKIKNWLK